VAVIKGKSQPSEAPSNTQDQTKPRESYVSTIKADDAWLFRRNILVASLVMVLIFVVSSIVYVNVNTNRVNSQVDSYLEHFNEQSATLVENWADASSDELNLVADQAADVYEQKGGIGADELAEFTKQSAFDFVTFSKPDGSTTDQFSNKTNVAQQKFFTEAMQKQSGVLFSETFDLADGHSMIFYAPVVVKGEVVGVLAGVYQSAFMEDLLASYLFGKDVSTYLCTSDGTVVAQSSVHNAGDISNIQDIYFSGGNEKNDETYRDFLTALHEGTSLAFSYSNDLGSGRAFLMEVPNTSWVIMKSFPSSATEDIIRNADIAGMLYASFLVLAFVFFGLYIYVQIRIRRTRFEKEVQKIDDILNSVFTLFGRFILVDLEEGRYQYLKDTGADEDLPRSGDYQMLNYYWTTRYSGGEDASVLHEVFTSGHIRRSLGPDVPYLQMEYQITERETEEIKWFRASVIPLERNAVGEPLKVLLSVQDVTEHKEREIENQRTLETALAQAQSASRAKTDFLNAMSHDIRTPMNSIMGLTSIAIMRMNDPARVKDCLIKIKGASRHLLDLINEVLDMAKIESGTLTLSQDEFSLSESIDNLLDLMMPQIDKKGLTFKVEVADMVHDTVVGDAHRLQQIFVNIMSNAVKFTPAGGTIGFMVEELVSDVEGCHCFRFVFTDTGCGMSEEFAAKMFDPFMRAADTRVNEGEGTGLGMSIVKSLVDLMQGNISVRSALGVGTAIEVVLHLKRPQGSTLRGLPTGESGTSDKASTEIYIEGKRLLVVGDESGVCGMLRSMGARVVHALTGEDALVLVKQAADDGTPYDAVLVDSVLPGMSGIDTARGIGSLEMEERPLLVLASYDCALIEREARAAGVNSLVSKPLFRKHVEQLMSELFGGGLVEPTLEFDQLQAARFECGRLLLVEDNAIAAEIALDLLGMTGLQVDRVENGKKAVERLLARPPHTYDLVLMDIQMPLMNGYEATRAIRAAAKGEGLSKKRIVPRRDLADLPIVAISADAFVDDVAKAKAAGMTAHIAKPLEIENVLKVLREYLPQGSGETQSSVTQPSADLMNGGAPDRATAREGSGE
jgi:signal transduction histidine kinase/CheY-like chemotaxis protein